MSDIFDVYLDPEQDDGTVKSHLNFPVVGIGSSAGGLQALLTFFENMPPDSGMAFVIILHLAPEHESSVAHILQRVTPMAVVQVAEPVAIEADHVYVIPPNHDLAMSDGELRLSSPTRIVGKHIAIDLFFRSLAEAHQERAVAIVMSGTGADGAAGLARVKERGGITLCQAIEDAEYGDMPRAAIGTGTVDFVLPVAQMPQRLVELWRNASRIHLPTAGTNASLRVIEERDADDSKRSKEALRDIMALLRKYSKNDFRHYKQATVLRRIERRLQVNALPDLPAYRDYLREHPEEALPLLQDMLISVTNFFRDPQAFEALAQEALPGLLQGRSPDEPVRVWVVGCATGEEAYSVTMLLQEQMEAQHCTSELQVFASDIDEKAINFGRNALYPPAIAADVSPERLGKFFALEQDRYRVVKTVREKVLFALHNVLRDPPFSKLDLICCRNLLIYLDRQAQSQVLEIFRFALKSQGCLFLGSSESVDAGNNFFVAVDKKQRIYKTNPHAQVPLHAPVTLSLPRVSVSASHKSQSRHEASPASFARLHRKFLDEMVSPSVLVDEQHTIVHLSEGAGRFLLPASGKPSLNLMANVPPELTTELRTALFQAAHSSGMVQSVPVKVPRNGGQTLVRLSVQAFGVGSNEPPLLLVMFEDVTEKLPQPPLQSADPVHEQVIRQLENDIRQLKDTLQLTIEQAETSTEEFRASNEELQAINEELRSATEELETSKEELQSINEELTTVNFELKFKVDETSKINDDLQNFIISTDIATIFVDRGLRIKRFTPQAATIFNLIASDIDRPLSHITHKLDYGSLADDAAAMLKTLTLVERSVRSSDGRHYLMRLRPYRTVEDRIDGAVLTFVDVTALHLAEEKVRMGEERLRIAAETTKDYAILTIDEQGLVTSWNLGAHRIFGYSEKEMLGQHFSILYTLEDRAVGAPEEELRGAREEGRSTDERWHLRKGGSTFFCSGVVTRMEGALGGYAKIARDMTESKRLETSREELLVMEKQANELKDQFLAVMSHELKHPLNLIQVNTELLISQPEVRELPAVIRAGETIRLAVASQTKIIDDLLDLSRAQTGKLTLKMAPTNLNELTSAITAAARDLAAKKYLTLNFECAEEQVVAMCDRVRTEQIYWNLINNAIKFTPEGGRITIKLERDGDFSRFSVTDTGQGIAPAFLPQVFGMFVQAPERSLGTNSGLGVGLTLVRDLTVAQGGKVLADSPGLGLGASFTVWIPLAKALPQEKEAPEPAGNLKGMKILAVDDMIDLLEPFAALLSLEGAEVDLATSGQQALEMLDAKAYDLLISDIGMPQMDGYELIREIRKRPALARLKTIALSGYGRQSDAVRALQSGYSAHLSKPATVAYVCQTIAQLVRSESAA